MKLGCNDDEFNTTDDVNVWTEDDEGRLDCDGKLTIDCGDVEYSCENKSLEEAED